MLCKHYKDKVAEEAKALDVNAEREKALRDNAERDKPSPVVVPPCDAKVTAKRAKAIAVENKKNIKAVQDSLFWQKIKADLGLYRFPVSHRDPVNPVKITEPNYPYIKVVEKQGMLIL